MVIIPRSYRSFYSFWHLIINERVQRNLKDSLRDRIHLEGQPHNSREQFSSMDSCTVPRNLLLILGDTTWMSLYYSHQMISCLNRSNRNKGGRWGIKKWKEKTKDREVKIRKIYWYFLFINFVCVCIRTCFYLSVEYCCNLYIWV